MKKLVKLVFAFLLVMSMGGCASGGATKSSSSQESLVELVVKTDNDQTDEKVTFKDGESVMDVLKANYKVEEKNGLITSIDGVKQDEKAGKYWMFKVNGEVAPKGAKDIKVKDGDKIDFYQEVYK